MIVNQQAARALSGGRAHWIEPLAGRRAVEIRRLEPSDATVRIGAAGAPAPRLVWASVFGKISGLASVFPGHIPWPPPRLGYIAVARTDPDTEEVIVGISALRSFDRGLRCRCDVLVDGDWNEHGLGVALMAQLLDIARTLGMRRLYARCSEHDLVTVDLLHRLGFRARRDEHCPTWLLHEFNLPGPA